MNIYSITRKGLAKMLKQSGLSANKANEIFKAIYQNQYKPFFEINEIGKATKEFLMTNLTQDLPKIITIEENETAAKILLHLSDNSMVEAVVMKHNYGNGLCISTQVGCHMGCDFCESGRLKRVRNLYTHEMVGQILAIEQAIDTKIRHVSVMGIGEPFDNFGNLMNFLEIANDDFGLAFGRRHITVSTCGLVPRIIDFANLNAPANLAISLHAPSDKIRNKIMPINKTYPINELMKAVRFYQEKVNRKITFEYLMLDGINDTENCANDLSDLLENVYCYVNLIPYNHTSNTIYKRSSQERISTFYKILKTRGLYVITRKEFGGDISGACGQLSSKHTKN